MVTAISQLSHAAHVHVGKPLLFRMSPDFVHKQTVAVGSVAQRVPFFSPLMRSCLAYQNPTLLSQTLNGIEYANPVGLSAGFDKNFELLPLMKSLGFGFVEGGSLTYEPCAGNAKPWFYRLPQTKSIVVHAGLANQGVERIVCRILDYSPELLRDFPLNISIAKTNSKHTADAERGIADYANSLRIVKNSNVGNLATLNISCPNAYGGEPFTTPTSLERLLTATDAVGFEKPLYLKMPCIPWKKTRPLVEVASRHAVAGLTFSNLAKDRTNPAIKDTLPDTVKGGLSGKPTQALSNELIRRTYVEYGNRFVLIGVGGIFGAQDAYTKIRLGASLVELITGMIFEGPQLIGRINHDLDGMLERDGFSHISQAVGVDARR